jgi:pimeloyl-ACP methyl ester carboxylesterase
MTRFSPQFVRWRGPRLGAWALACLLGISATEAVLAGDLSPPGQLVDLGTHRLYLHCKGTGRPSVIMEAGLGGLGLEWTYVQDHLARDLQACVYDRAGYGWSEAGPSPRTSARIADELLALLQKSGISAPYILVGHSFGGYTMQLFASRHPEATAGVVLIDSSHPEQAERLAGTRTADNEAQRPGYRYVHLFLNATQLPENLTPEIKEIMWRLLVKPRTRQAIVDEYLHFRQSTQEVRDSRPFPDVPLVVITRGRRVWPQNRHGDFMERAWLALQDELAGLSPRSAHLIAERSGHFVHIDQPELVAEAVRLLASFDRSAGLRPWSELARTPRRPLAFRDARWRVNRLALREPLAHAQSGASD